MMLEQALCHMVKAISYSVVQLSMNNHLCLCENSI